MARGGGNINWDDVRADFGGANQAMGAAIGGMSQAGTIFGNLRKSILDEEQRAVENAYREKEFAEKTRQFEATQGLAERRFGLEGEKFGYEKDRDVVKDSQWLRETELKELSESNLNKYRTASNAIQSRQVGLAEKKYQQEELDRAYLSQAINENTANRNALQTDINSAESKINSGTLTPGELAVENNNLKKLRTSLTATGNFSDIAARSVELGGNPLLAVQDYQTRSAREYEIAKESRKQSTEARKAYDASEVKAFNAVKGMNLGKDDNAAMNKLLATAKVVYPNLSPERIVAMVGASAPTTSEWKIPFVGDKRFKLDEGMFPWSSNDLRDLNLSDSSNKLAQNLALMAGKPEYLITDDTVSSPSAKPDLAPISADNTVSDLNKYNITDEMIQDRVRLLANRGTRDTIGSPKTQEKAIDQLLKEAREDANEKAREEKRRKEDEERESRVKEIRSRLQ